MKELFMPNSPTLQNDIQDISLENNRYLTLPYYFPDSDEFKKSKKSVLKMLHKHQEPAETIEIRAFCVIFVLDAYQSDHPPNL
jgi:hypothetical protein